MAQPTQYTRQYNFNDFQTTSPADPLPGVQVDNELNAAKTNLDGLNANLAKIQRDDGLLANQSVHKNALDTDVLALIGLSGYTVSGNWAASNAYTAGTLVNYNDATYLSTTAHTSSNAFATDLNAEKWILLANAAINTSASTVDKFEGTGSQTAFTLTYTYTSNTDVLVFVNGALRNPGDDYTISGNTITFSTAPSTPSVSGNENVIIWGPNVTVQAAKAAAESASTDAQGFANEADDWARKTTGLVESTDYSSKAYAVGGTGVDNGAGSSKDWATKTSGTVGNTSEYSAKYWATSTSVTNVSDNISDVQTVAGEISPTNNIATVAGKATELGLLGTADAISDMNTLGTADVVSDMNTLATTSNVANMSTLAGISTDITTVAGKASFITADFVSDLNTVAVTDVIADINTLATSDIVADMNLLATTDIVSDLNTLATTDIVNDINTLATTDIVNDLNQLATSDFVADLNTMATTANVNNLSTVATNISDVSTAASSISEITSFNELFSVGTTAPSSPSAGDLWYDTANSRLMVYVSNSFQQAGAYLQGLTSTHVFTATANQTDFATDDSSNTMSIYANGNTLVFMNGIRLTEGTTSTNDYYIDGNTIKLNSAADAGDLLLVEVFTKISTTQENSLNTLVTTAQGHANTASGHATTATTKASEASTSASNASTSEGNAAASASTATTKAGEASTSASNASTSESNAASSASAAAASATAAQNAANFSVGGDTTPELGGDLDVLTHDIVSSSNRNIDLLPNGTGKVNLDGDGSASGVAVSDGLVEMRTGSGSPAQIDMYCEVSNAHKVSIKAPAHSQYSGNVNFTLPAGNGTNGQFLQTDGSGNLSYATVDLTSINIATDTTPQLGGDLDANSNDILMGAQSLKFGTSKWEIVLDSGDNDLLFKYNGTTVFKLASNGAVTSANDVTAFGSP